MKVLYLRIKRLIRCMAIPFHAYRMLRELESIKSIIAFKEGRLTETEKQVLVISRESVTHTTFKWYKIKS